MKSNILRLALAGITAALLVTAYERMSTARTMTDSAKAFLNSLGAEQKLKANLKFEDDDRMFFHFVPNESIMQLRGKSRLGLTFGEMHPYQRHLASALLSAGLSDAGYRKAVSIMSLEDILKLMENDQSGRRNPEKYHFTIFGEPSEKGAWGYRVDGHHVSLHFLIVNGKVAAAPMFFGTNPAEVKAGPRAGLRVLGREEDMGRGLYTSLSDEQRKTALVSATAYKDILTEASRKATIAGQPNGLPASQMTDAQRAMLADIVEEYIRNVPPEVAAARREKLKAAGTNLHFAWAGGPKRGDPHYYRVAAPTFLVEYDNTQNEANHVHSVWREYDGDFGLDLLKMHYESSHKP